MSLFNEENFGKCRKKGRCFTHATCALIKLTIKLQTRQTQLRAGYFSKSTGN